MMKSFLLLFLLTGSIVSHAGFDLKSVFSGMSTNVTKAGSFQDQAAGYYSGGGLSMRMKRSSFRPVSVTPPKLKMGCGGIDMTFGSFSFISGQQMVDLAKQIATQGGSYAFQLGIKTFAPQIENLMKEMRDLAMELNQFSVEDCHAVQSAFASLLPKGSAMRDMACKDIGRKANARDYFGARESCDKEAEQKKATQEYAKKDAEMLIDDFNLFMKAADKVGIPKEMREGMMSMVGTLVMKDGVARHYEALAKEERTWNAHIRGGADVSGSLYKCGDDSCLDIEEKKDHIISEEASYQGQAKKTLDLLKEKFNRNQALTAADQQFLTSMGTTFPLYQYITLEQVTGVSLLENTSELVANYMLLEHLKKITGEIQKSLSLLEGKQMDADAIKAYRASLWKLQEFADAKWGAMLDQAEKIDQAAYRLESALLTRGR
jgi:conjugative transfer pilus assembly protein TraH